MLSLKGFTRLLLTQMEMQAVLTFSDPYNSS